MAQDAKVTVAVESAVHDAFRKMAQTIFQEHGMIVDRVEFSWADLTTFGGKPNAITTQVEIESRKPYLNAEVS